MKRVAVCVIMSLVAACGANGELSGSGTPSRSAAAPHEPPSARPSLGEQLGRDGTTKTPVPAQTSRSAGRWKVVYRQKGDDREQVFQSVMFTDVAAVGEDRAWAVGERAYSTAGHEPLLAEWDGRRWRKVMDALPKEVRMCHLTRVDASDPGNVWVIAHDPEGGEDGLLHFDGQRWSHTPGMRQEEVLALPGGRAWTFGRKARYFDGSRWTDHPIPINVQAAQALSPESIWAVGEVSTPCGRGTCGVPAAAYFDGRSWRRTPLSVAESAVSFDTTLKAVLAVDGDKVWAAGGFTTPDGAFRPVLYQWNGGSWQAVNVSGGQITGLARDSRGALWAATTRWTPEGPDGYRLLTRGDGPWRSVRPPGPITAVTQTAGGTLLWGVGGDTIVRYMT
ncbi:hypothetical protein [Nonomuraea cavernae]|nr:hypothetical protein [Nonomuraea cavernae]MCA2184337.1 hypothetical protein [Nonomuraea cavernae]